MSEILTEDIFYDVFKPYKNPFQPNGTSFGDVMFETFGEELEFVLSFANDLKRSQRVWTIVEVDGEMYLTAGFHIINRVGYIITEKEWETGTEEFQYEGVDSDEPLSYIVYKDDYTDREYYDLIAMQYNLPSFEELFDSEGEVVEEYRDFFSEGASTEVLHENIRISDMETLDKFLLEDAGTHNSMDERIRELIWNKIFQVAGDGGDLGFIVDIWESQDALNNGDEPIGSYQLWFEDYWD